jgi:hypothetical protein
MATRGSMPNAAAVAALEIAICDSSWAVGSTLMAQSPKTYTLRAPPHAHAGCMLRCAEGWGGVVKSAHGRAGGSATRGAGEGEQPVGEQHEEDRGDE